MSGPSIRRGSSGFLVTTLLLVMALSLLAWLLARHDVRWDVSVGERRTLAPETQEVLALLDRPVQVLGFYADVPADEDRMRELLERYQRANDGIDVRFVDLDRRPELAQEYGIVQNRTLVLSGGELRVSVTDPTEPEITGALLRLMRDVPTYVRFVTGHGEASLDDTSRRGLSELGEELRRQNLMADPWWLPGSGGFPSPTDVLVVAAPEGGFLPPELAMLDAYLLGGGRVMVLVEPLGSASMDSFLVRFGIRPRSDFVFDPSSAQRNLVGAGNERIALGFPAAVEHPALTGFNLPTLFPLARSLEATQPPPPGVRAQRLIQTDPAAWGEADLRALAAGQPSLRPGEGDRPGPLALAFGVEIDSRAFAAGEDTTGLRQLVGGLITSSQGASGAADTVRVGGRDFSMSKTASARLVVLGDVDFVNNANMRVRGNLELFLRLLLWLTDQDVRAALAPWGIDADRVVLSATQIRWARWLGMLLVPAIPFASCAAVLWLRRRWI